LYCRHLRAVRERRSSSQKDQADHFDAGIKALNRTAEPDGVFCYTFFKGVGVL